MNKLFLITWRWLKRDKKRTALTFWSIVLAVYLISFVGVYMSTALSAYKASIVYSYPEHAVIDLENMEQAETLDKNVAWESHFMMQGNESFLTDTFIDNYGNSHDSVFPLIEVNGKSIFTDTWFNGAVMSGDADKLLGEDCFQLTGELPSQAHEVALNKIYADSIGVTGIGDTVTIRYGAQKGTLWYAELDEQDKPIRDDNGEVIYIEDKYGLKLKYIYAALHGSYGCNDVFEKFFRAEEGGKPYDHPTETENWLTGDYITLSPAYAVLSDEKEVSFEYTAKVTGIFVGGSNGNLTTDIAFSPEDTDIMPFFEGQPISYYVRVKEGIDAELAIMDALKGIGLYDDDHSNYDLNADLLILEGRQLEYLGNVGAMFALAAIVMWLFVFLARLIINNAFEISAAYRTEQYGALKTVGASDKQIFIMIMFECALYMLTALPIGFFGAVATGRVILTKIREIGVFDPIYGEGVSERFFVLELSPVVMIITFSCAMFSIFFSAYADAMRVKRMPPIQSLGYGSRKKIRNRRSLWLSRRFLGYPRGYAIKCISKQKVRFSVTLLAAVMSGIFIMTFAGVANIYSHYNADYIDISPDMTVYTTSRDDKGPTTDELRESYQKLADSGLFKEVIPDTLIYLHNGENADSCNKYLTEEYRSLISPYYDSTQFNLHGMFIYAVTPEMYDKYVISDMSYDEFAASGKVLLCNTVGLNYYDETDMWWKDMGYGVTDSYYVGDGLKVDILDTQVFATENIDTLELTGSYFGEDGPVDLTETVEVGGFYETNTPQFATSDRILTGILPFDSIGDNSFVSQTAEVYDPMYNNGFSLTVREGCVMQARSLLNEEFPDGEIEDSTSSKLFNSNLVKALKIAGFGFASSLAAVVLLNIFSTMSANMINRRRDFSMMRSCGMSLKQVRKSLYVEGRIYALVTTIVSSAAGWILAVSVYDLFVTGYGYDYARYFPWQASILVFAVIMLTISAAILPALAAMKKQNIAEEIRTDI